MTSISYKEYEYLMTRISYWLINNNKKIKTRSVYNVKGKGVKYAEMKKKILAKNTTYSTVFAESAIIDNKNYELFPNYVTGHNKTVYYLNCYSDMAKRVYAFRVKNRRDPVTVNVQGNNKVNTTSKDKTLSLFEEAFGKVTDFDSALRKIKGRGYKYYYNSVYNTKDTLSRIKKGLGVNCTDSSQLMYRIGLALGYKVEFIHVQCKTGGHIRLRLKHAHNTGGKWIYRDPACVLSNNGKNVDCNWCMDGRIIAYNPAWVLADVMA